MTEEQKHGITSAAVGNSTKEWTDFNLHLLKDTKVHRYLAVIIPRTEQKPVSLTRMCRHCYTTDKT